MLCNQSGDSSELASRLPCKGKSVRNRGVSQTMPFLVIPRSLLRGGFIPAFDRRLGNGNQEQRGKEKRTVPETDSAHHREVAGQPDHAVAHMLRCRDTLNVRCEVHPPVLIVEVIPLRDDEPILYRIVECRQFMK